jgi:hypothetical protein
MDMGPLSSYLANFSGTRNVTDTGNILDWMLANRALIASVSRSISPGIVCNLARRAFSLRELDGLGTEEICKILDITATNLWVILHRARGKLRDCLEINWFAER